MPSRRATSAALLVVGALIGCDRPGSGGRLPPAEDWRAATPLGGAAAATGAGHEGHGHGDPHAGMDLGDEGVPGDPHAGLDLAGAADPHAGMDLDGDPAMAGLAAPDPDRPIDPSRYLRGRIVAAPGADAIAPGSILFLSVKPIDPASGDIIGATLAAERIDVRALPVDFALTEANSMIAGTELTGDVLVLAWIDRDGEARTRAEGEVEGRLRTRVPAAGLELALDAAYRGN